MKIEIEKGEDAYRLVGPNGQEGDFTEYTEPATITIGGKVYWALLPDAETEYEEFGSFVYPLGQPIETEVVELVEDDEEDEEDDGEGDEPEEVGT